MQSLYFRVQITVSYNCLLLLLLFVLATNVDKSVFHKLFVLLYVSFQFIYSTERDNLVPQVVV